MPRYIDTDILAKIVFDKWQECDELKQIIPAMRNAIMCASTTDMVDKERYDRLVENSLIISKALNEYQTADFVKVVRCKDCKHSVKHQLGYGCGMNYHLATNGEWFCADGERRDNGEIH